MKHITLVTCMVTLSLQSHGETPQHLQSCEARYTQDVETVLRQFKALVSQEKIKDYETYMIVTKLATDLRFILDALEETFTSTERALLRTPLQEYSVCRTSLSSLKGLGYQHQGPSKKVLSPCEKNYALAVQKIRNQLSVSVSSKKLELSTKFMILIKYFTDLVFEAEEFEKRTSLPTKSRLQFPLQKYKARCSDLLVARSRMSLPASY